MQSLQDFQAIEVHCIIGRTVYCTALARCINIHAYYIAVMLRVTRWSFSCASQHRSTVVALK